MVQSWQSWHWFAGHLPVIQQSMSAENEKQHLLLLLPVQLWEVSGSEGH